jgi:hypothetical protein
MSRIALIIFCVAAIAAWLPGQDGSPPEPPSDKNGVYYRESSSEWIMLDPAMLSDSRTRGMDRFVATDGITGLSVTLTFDGSNSPVQIQDRRPKFYVRGFTPAEDTLIVQLTVKRDGREAQTSMAAAGMTNREGFRNADIHRVIASKLDDDLYAISPQETLKSGEYLLVFGRVETSFNFGIPK